MALQHPVENPDHAPENLGGAAADALRDHGAETRKLVADVADRMQRIAAWAWQGEGDAAGMPGLVLEVATSLFRSPADAHYGRPLLADPEASTWLEDLLGVVGNDTPLGQTLLAAAVRCDLAVGRSILPSTLAVLFRVDSARVRWLIQKGQLVDANASSPAAGRSGHRPKGTEARVTAASAIRWLVENGRAPAGAALPDQPKARPARRAKA